MVTEIFSRGVGRALANADGLFSAQLSPDIPEHSAVTIVRYANRARAGYVQPANPTPFALLINAKGVCSASDVIAVTPHKAAGYREDDHLVVVHGHCPDLPTIEGVFRPVLTLSYPAEAKSPCGLEELAHSTALELWAHCNLDVDVWSFEVATQWLQSALEDCKQLHEASKSASTTWNVAWFQHCVVAVDTIAVELIRAVGSSENQDLKQWFEINTYAAFGMPRPSSSQGLKRPLSKLLDVFEERWASESQLLESKQRILAFSGREPGSFSDLEAIGLDDCLGEVSVPFWALALHGSRNSTVLPALADLTEAEFLGLGDTAAEPEALSLEDEGGLVPTVAGLSPELVVIVGRLEEVDKKQQLVSQTLEVTIPCTSAIDELPDFVSHGVRITSTAKSDSFEFTLSMSSDGALIARGNLRRKLSGKPPQVNARVASLRVEVDANSPLQGLVSAGSKSQYLIVAAEQPGLVIWALGKAGKAKQPHYIGESHLQNDSGVRATSWQADVEPAEHVLLLWGESDDGASIDGKELAPARAGDRVFTTLLELRADVQVELDKYRWLLHPRAEESSVRAPLVAAIRKRPLQIEAAGADLQSGIQAAFERFVVHGIGNETWLHGNLGHVSVFAEQLGSLDELVLEKDARVWLPADAVETWRSGFHFHLPSGFTVSPEANAFRAAFDALRIRESLAHEDLGFTQWPSLTSWRHLWDTPELLAYLDAHEALIEAARATNNEVAIFWASYPFSLSVWSNDGVPNCLAVLLSPLHPLRLAWLAAAEHTLHAAERSADLAGSVEGWNIPLLGPRGNYGRMVAVPVDNGPDQVFIGWSMLVAASTAGPEPLRPPPMASGYALPPSSVSGLNAGAVAAALRNFRKMHPHVASLTVDLAASAPSPRVPEIDGSLIDALTKWQSGHAPLRGLTVWDSLNRTGEAPRERIARIVDASGSEVPLRWSRYKPDGIDRDSNIRILQDAGVSVLVTTAPNEPGTGHVPDVPLRRFDVPRGAGNVRGSAKITPTMVTEPGSTAFVRLLGALEDAGAGPVVQVHMAGGAFLKDRADWTISGEALAGPSALADLVASVPSNVRMLWEWRPALLEVTDGSGESSLEQRPYVAVVRVPDAFRVQVGGLLTAATGRPATEAEVDSVLSTLGSRGVGLSSLLSMGGTHATGALGFFLAMQLVDSLAVDGVCHFLIPIDAAERFLTVLTGQSLDDTSNRRADLLLISVDDDRCLLTPIEIKYYGLGEDAGHFPSIGSAIVQDAVEQAEVTSALVDALCREAKLLGEASNASDGILWRNAFAALLETAAKLNPPRGRGRELAAQWVARLLAGTYAPESARAVVLFMKQGAKSATGAACSLADAGQSRRIRILFADPTELLSGDDSRCAGIQAAWGSVIGWSLSMADDEAALHGSVELSTADAVDLGDTETPSESSDTAADAATANPVITDDAAVVEQQASADLVDKLAPVVLPSDEHTDGILDLGVRFAVGSFIGGVGQGEAEFWPGSTELNQLNVGVLGDMGTGKTQLAQALVRRLRESSLATQPSPISVLILDYKRDYKTDAFLNAVGGVALEPEHLPLNFFAINGEYTNLKAVKRARDFADVLKKIYTGIGPMQVQRLVEVIKELYMSHPGFPPTMSKVLDKYRKANDGKADAVTAVLGTFVDLEIFSEDAAEMRKLRRNT